MSLARHSLRWNFRQSYRTFATCGDSRGNNDSASPTIAWKLPSGHHTGINLYNCVARTTVPFIVRNPNCVTWYTCGPTVYDSAHIGHAVCYMKLDIIQQILRNHFQLNLVTAMNITDIDDKIIQRSRERNIPHTELTTKYESEFWRDLTRLGIRRADIVLRVSDSMEDIIEFIHKLLAKQAAYIGRDGSVYFRNAGVQNKLQNVGSGEDLSQQPQRTVDAIRESRIDFALWKCSKADEPCWQVPWKDAADANVSTAGRPGWHTECSAMATKLFGNVIDVHAGGIDLRFPHHENEESQCNAYHNRSQWVNYWIHIGHLVTTDNVKMSKSLKNTISIDELLTHYTRDQFRMACALTQYRTHIEFSDATMIKASGTLHTFASFLDNTNNYCAHREQQRPIDSIEQLRTKLDSVCGELDAALKNEFDTPHCIQLLADLMKTFNRAMACKPNESVATGVDGDGVDSVTGVELIQSAHNIVRRFLHTCGFIDTIERFESIHLPNANATDQLNVHKLINELIALRSDLRATAKSNKNQQLFEICSQLRQLLNDNGVEVKDHKSTSTWQFNDAFRIKSK